MPPLVGAAPETLQLLCGHEWPGNVRQLENAVYRAIVLSDAPYLQPHDFPAISGVAMSLESGAAPAPAPATPTLPDAAQLMEEVRAEAPVRFLDGRGHLRTLEEIERDLIQLAIEIYAGRARRFGGAVDAPSV